MAEMKHKEPSEVIHTRPATAFERTPDCPDDHELAVGADGQLSAENVQRFTEHLAQCDFCTTQVSLLKRLHESVPDQQVSEFVLARANHMAKDHKRPAFSYGLRWASAAVLVLAVLVVFKWSSQGLVDPQITDIASHGLTSEGLDHSQVRNRDLNILMPRVLAPATGTTIDPGKLVFQWTGVPGSLYYDVRVVTDGGDLVWQARVEGTELGLPEHLQLAPDVEYYFRVDAYLASARSISSKHVLFSIGEQH